MAALSDMMEIQLLSRVAAGESLSEAEAEANDDRQRIIGVCQVLVLLATAITFFTWFYRSHKNLPALGVTGLKYSPGWAIGGFFVPFLNLVRPLQVMREVWHGSAPESPVGLTSAPMFAESTKQETPRKVGWWWGLFLVSSFLGQMAFRLSLRDDPSLQVLEATSWMTLGSDVADIAGLLVTVALVQTITSRQTEKSRRLIASPARPGQLELVSRP
jgi:hypothetical protein